MMTAAEIEQLLVMAEEARQRAQPGYYEEWLRDRNPDQREAIRKHFEAKGNGHAAGAKASAMLTAALEYIARGWNPLPLPYRSKIPQGEGWQRRVMDAATASRYFNGGPINIGVILGASSKGLTDVDLDCTEAIAIAPYILPITKAVFGRQSKRNSHYLYNTTLADTVELAAIQLHDPTNKTMLLELRIGGGGKGAQTVFPGSTHEGGEVITWEVDGEPAKVDGDELKRKAYQVAAFSLLARYWPKVKSDRHNRARIVGGFLARCGMTRKPAKHVMTAIAKAAGDEEWTDRAKAAHDAVAAFESGSNTYGYPALAEAFGEGIATKVAAWLGFQDGETADDLLRSPGGSPEGQAEQDAGAKAGANTGTNTGPAPTVTLAHINADEVAIRAIEWLWPNRFALGKIGLLAGLPDEGKGQILCDITARVTKVGEWPLGEGRVEAGNVILLTAEDALDDTVVPRLKAAGADLTRVKIIQMVKSASDQRMFSFVTDLALLRKKVAEIGDVKLILIDPLTAYLGVKKIDSFRTTDVRAVLGPLIDFASELRVAVIAVMHFNKKVDVTNALLRISDSLAFGAAARHVWAAIDDSANQRKLFVKGKNNLAPANLKSLSYGFGVQEVGKDPKTGRPIMAPHIVWLNHVDVSATEAMQAANEGKSPGAREAAHRLLKELLANGPVLTSEIEEAAEANGVSERSLNRARQELGIPARRDGPNGAWRCHPPLSWPE